MVFVKNRLNNEVVKGSLNNVVNRLFSTRSGLHDVVFVKYYRLNNEVV